MKQLGNLAVVCAQRRSVELWMENGEVRITIHSFPGSPSLYLRWDDDKKIEEVIHAERSKHSAGPLIYCSSCWEKVREKWAEMPSLKKITGGM